MTPYSDQRQMKLQPSELGASWTVEMEPFDLVGGEISAANVKVVSWSVTPPPDTGTVLAEQSRDIAFRVPYVQKQTHSLPVPNASFEDRGMEAVPAWLHATAPGLVVEVDRTKGRPS